MDRLLDLPYFPRPSLLESVLKIYLSGLKQGVTLFAPRRQGKTLFVKKELIPAGDEAGWRVVYLDLWARRSHPELALVEGLEAELERLRGRRYKVTKVTAKAKTPAVEVGGEAEQVGVAAEPVLENRLTASMEALVAHSAGITLLVLDEFQALAGASSTDFVAAFRTVLQRHQGKLLVFYTGSSREALNEMFRRQKAPLFESAFSFTLPDLERDFVIDRVQFLYDRTGLKVDVDALDAAFVRLGRSPEYLNAIIINLMIGGYTDVDAAMHAWVEGQREEGVVAQLRDFNACDLAVLRMLALPEHPKPFSQEAVRFVEEHLQDGTPATTSRIQSSIRRLLRRHLVTSTGDHGNYEVEDRGLLVWLREAEGDHGIR
jgi:hypothetical protein